MREEEVPRAHFETAAFPPTCVVGWSVIVISIVDTSRVFHVRTMTLLKNKTLPTNAFKLFHTSDMTTKVVQVWTLNNAFFDAHV